NAIRSGQPAVCRARIDDVLANEESWFGELSGRRGGGAMALITLSAEGQTSGQIALRNPAALGLRIVDEPDLLGLRVQNRELTVRGWGATRDRDFESTFALWQAACREVSEAELRREVEAADHEAEFL